MRHKEKDYSDIPVSLSDDEFQKHFKRIKSGEIPNISGKYYAAKDVKVKLKQIYSGKCSYCERPIGHETIEHYRPCDKYRLLAYEWSNLLPACYKCNNSKRAQFPVETRYFGNETNAKVLNIKENPEILNPEIDFPKDHFEFTIAGEMIGITNRAQQTINICQLNRSILVNERLQKIKDIFKSINFVIADFIASETRNGDDLKNNLIRRIREIPVKMHDNKAYSLTIWYMYEKEFDKFLLEYIPNKTQRDYVKKAYEIFSRSNVLKII